LTVAVANVFSPTNTEDFASATSTLATGAGPDGPLPPHATVARKQAVVTDLTTTLMEEMRAA
jgi:hypothetical protein